MTETNSLIVNGKIEYLKTSIPIADFLKEKNLELKQVVIEYNGKALTRDEAKKILLKTGDKLEILRIIAGG